MMKPGCWSRSDAVAVPSCSPARRPARLSGSGAVLRTGFKASPHVGCSSWRLRGPGPGVIPLARWPLRWLSLAARRPAPALAQLNAELLLHAGYLVRELLADETDVLGRHHGAAAAERLVERPLHECRALDLAHQRGAVVLPHPVGPAAGERRDREQPRLAGWQP